MPKKARHSWPAEARHKRKNWLSIGSPRGGQTAAVLFSFTSTCQRLGVEPWHYLCDVLARLPSHRAERLEEMLPDKWDKLAAERHGRGVAADGV